MMAALGVDSRPAFTRTCSRSTFCMRDPVPSLRHQRKSLHTVDQEETHVVRLAIGNRCGPEKGEQ
jgi:hypothetical protein